MRLKISKAAPFLSSSPYNYDCITKLNFRPQLAEEENQQKVVESGREVENIKRDDARAA